VSRDTPDRWPIVLGLFGLGNLINGAWMLASPAHWYVNLPADVPGTGPLNEHFVRDIGCIFFLLGVALLVSIPRRQMRVAAMTAAAAYSAAHALVHVYDQARGLFTAEHFRVDVGPVYVSTLLLVVLAWKLRRDEAASARAGVRERP
jgi:hypothetical protein